jgi:cysteine sulfinate desulfinase/cysteine desulfurase-like protein
VAGSHHGAELELLAVDECGRMRPETLRAVLAAAPQRAALVSVMWATNEVGTVNPIRELGAVGHEFDVPLRTDAVQTVGVLPVDFAGCGADALTPTGHKLGGPYGQGALLLRREPACVPSLHGGGQERDVRSGTLNVPAVVCLAVAVGHAVAEAPRRFTVGRDGGGVDPEPAAARALRARAPAHVGLEVAQECECVEQQPGRIGEGEWKRGAAGKWGCRPIEGPVGLGGDDCSAGSGAG